MASLLDSLRVHFGYTSFRVGQEALVRAVLDGHDVLAVMPTGSGKSLGFQLPALVLPGTTLVVSPLISLMKDQVDELNRRGIRAAALHSMLTADERRAALNAARDGVLRLLYVAPERFASDHFLELLRRIPVARFVIDEAHCVSEWGHDFRPEYRRIRPIVNKIGKAPILALTATATPKVQSDIQKNLEMMDANVFKSSFNRENLYYEVRPKVDATKEIIKFIKNNPGKSGIIYCLSRKKVEEVAEALQVNGIKALAYHAGMDAATRSLNQDKFLMEDIDVIVATIAFGMGIDKPDVRFVIHYDVPKSLEGYYQETGRAGRDGGEGVCLSFYSYKDIQKLEKFMQGKPLAEQEIGKQLLLETVAYAESSLCRRKMLLHYFGEEYKEDNCENCDNCNHPKEQFDGMEDIVLALQAIIDVKDKFKSEHVANVLSGVKNSAIKSYKHHELEVFGQGSEHDTKYWNAIIRQALVAGFVDKDIENYGLLKVNQKGKAFMDNPETFMISKDHDYEAADDDFEGKTGAGKTGAVDSELFNILKDLRKKVAKNLNLPPFVIFQDPSLEDMAIQYPITQEEMTRIVGVGTGKAQKYGKEFIELIKKYVDEKEIIRPQDMIVKSVVNKSGLKVYIIQSIDRQMSLEDIASAKGIEMSELLDEIESIVHSGTKLNIDYYINNVIDEDKQEDIFEYFREEAETESIDAALEELGEDQYSEEEIRLVRIKFFSELGN